jgi:hypothetical protein
VPADHPSRPTVLFFHTPRAAPELRDQPLYPHYLGFYDDKSRTAAHAAARDWLDEQPK